MQSFWPWNQKPSKMKLVPWTQKYMNKLYLSRDYLISFQWIDTLHSRCIKDQLRFHWDSVICTFIQWQYSAVVNIAICADISWNNGEGQNFCSAVLSCCAKMLEGNQMISTLYNTVDIWRYENLESLGKCFVSFVRMHLPSEFQGITFKCDR